MRVVRTISDLRDGLPAWRRAGERIGLVPTMGALHAGHMALVEAARSQCQRVVATIFVNPKQFAPGEDLSTYPRPEAADLDMFQSAGVDIAFLPTVDQMYPPQFTTVVQVGGLSEGLCGAHRAGHFDGVATVVTKLLMQTLPGHGLFRREGLPAIAGDPPDGARSRHPGRRSKECRSSASLMGSRCRRATDIYRLRSVVPHPNSPGYSAPLP